MTDSKRDDLVGMLNKWYLVDYIKKHDSFMDDDTWVSLINNILDWHNRQLAENLHEERKKIEEKYK